MKLFPLLLIFLLTATFLQAQISGIITDEKGEALPFASVYIQNSTQGTTSNVEGYYDLDLPKGAYTLVYQYVGYEQLVKEVRLGKEPLKLDIALKEQSVELGEVVVTTGGEDPAYAIIREAQKKRKFYLNQIKEYKCETYIKGNQKVSEVPETFMGIEIGDLGGILDSTGQGIIYLSESISDFYYQAPDKYKEVMISSKVSGDDNGFSFNRASALDFNFYKNTYDWIGKPIVSPIAFNAMNFYSYRLEGAFVDENGNTVNKIKVKRKRDTDPSIAGYIYIVEDTWNIHSVDMWTDGKAFAIPALDTIRVQQVYIPVKDDIWQVFSRNISFEFKIFGIGIDGVFTGMYRNYDVEPNLPEGFFDTEILKVEEGANEKDSLYWEKIRPIPLTQEETADYTKKDSLEIMWESKEFLDSMDRRMNKFGFMNLLTTYTYRNTYKQWNWRINSPLMAIQYNTVQGFFPYLTSTFHKDLDENGYKWIEVNGTGVYGFGDKEIRGNLKLDYQVNRTKFTRFGIEGGRMAAQFNEEEPIKEIQNTSAALSYRRSWVKLYDKRYLRFKAESELFNGFFVKGFAEYARRDPLVNTTDYSFFFRDSRIFTSNDPLRPQVYGEPSFSSHNAVTIGLDLRIRIKQEYYTYPKRKIISGSKYPDILVQYRRGIPILGGDTNFDFVSLALRDDDIRIGRAGYSKFNIETGLFLSKEALPFIDFHHFNGNQVGVTFFSQYMDQFRMLPYYDFSTNKPYFKTQWEHHFDGSALGKIPLIRKLQWELVTGTNYLYSDLSGNYAEVFIGFDNVGFGIFRIFRLDFTVNMGETIPKPKFRFSAGVDFDF